MKKSRIKTESKINKDGTVNISINCSCGKPIVSSNEFGMYCEDECGIENDKKASERFEKIFNNFKNLFK